MIKIVLSLDIHIVIIKENFSKRKKNNVEASRKNNNPDSIFEIMVSGLWGERRVIYYVCGF